MPTSLEAGYVDSDYTFWTGMFAPAKTPREIVERMNRELQKVLDVPALQQRLAQYGVDPMPITPTAFDTLVKTEVAANIALVKAAGIKVN